jgi:succinoglycan biosynthesis transport protein ExoP
VHAIPNTTPAALPGNSDSSGVANERQNGLASLWRALQRRRGTALKIFFGFVALMMIGTILWPKEYTTTIKVIAGNSSGSPGSGSGTPNADLPVLNALLIASGMQSSETYAELFKETPVLWQVIRELHLKTGPDGLLDHVAIQPIQNTNILSISVSWSDPVTSAAIANAFGAAIVNRERQLISSQADAALASLQQQMPAAQARMNDAQNKLSQFEAQHRIANIDEQTQAMITNMANLDSKIGQVQADRRQAQAQLNSTLAQLSKMKSTITGNTTTSENPVVSQLQQQLTQTNIQLQQALQQYTDQYPGVIALKDQKARLEQMIARQKQTVVANQSEVPNPVYQQLTQQADNLRAQAAADGAQIAELQRQRDAMGPQLAALPSQSAQLADLQRDAKASEDVYSALQQKYVDAQVASETALSDVTITQPASAHEASVRPSLMLNLIIGIVLGAMLGVTGALLLDYLDNTITDEREVEEELALPQLGAIPLVQLRNGTPALPWVKSLALESFLQLVTNIRYASDVRLRSLAVISPAQGDGKSMIALNIALALNEIEGPVLLVDSDLRRPSLHAKLRLPNERGLSDVLVGQASVDDAIQHDEKSRLAVMTSGTAAPNPIKLLESQRFEELLEELYERYRTVVFDGAALVGNIDSAVLARRVSGTVLVMSQGSTDLREARQAMHRLQRMGVRNVLGFVLNRIEPRRSDYTPYDADAPRLYADDAPILGATR